MSVPLAFSWRDALFANWRVDAAAVDERLPAPLSVQTHDGDAWLSIVPFVNANTRLRGLPAALGVDVPELNLRTYVTCDGEPGVYFFSLDMRSVVGVVGARLTHRLPYYYARMGVEERDGRTVVASRRRHPGARPARFAATYGSTGERVAAEPGSRAAFLTERRRLFTRGQDGAVRYTQVSHEPWPLYEAAYEELANTLFAANGFDRPDGEPVTYFSPGVSVTTTRSRRWRGEAPTPDYRSGRSSRAGPESTAPSWSNREP